jgi:hypothetical protein
MRNAPPPREEGHATQKKAVETKSGPRRNRALTFTS